jgi:hypothetical protein
MIFERDVLSRLILRLARIGIKIDLLGNLPWIYLDKVNGNRIKEKDYYLGNHGFTIAFYPCKIGKEMELTDITKVFKIIRKYK